jgi:hypothetical protein
MFSSTLAKTMAQELKLLERIEFLKAVIAL